MGYNPTHETGGASHPASRRRYSGGKAAMAQRCSANPARAWPAEARAKTRGYKPASMGRGFALSPGAAAAGISTFAMPRSLARRTGPGYGVFTP